MDESTSSLAHQFPPVVSPEWSESERLLLAKGHEEDILRADMARDLADMVMRRLASL